MAKRGVQSTRTPLGDLWGLLFHFDRFMGQRRQQADEHRHEGGRLTFNDALIFTDTGLSLKRTTDFALGDEDR